MALHYDYSDVPDVEALHNIGPDAFPKGTPEDTKGDEEFAITQALIWLTMSLGISKITEANAEKFATRLAMWQDVHGASMRRGGEDFFLTYDHVIRRVGLGTNASAKTDAVFRKQLVAELEKQATYKVSKAKRTMEVATA